MFVKEITVMNFENYFPLWNDLNIAQKKIISDNLITRDVKKGTIQFSDNLYLPKFMGYDNRIRTKYIAKWGVQIAGMIFQTRSNVSTC